MYIKFFMKTPSAWVPIFMSILALSLVLGHVMIFGNVHQEDEGTAAHIFQILMAGQIPIIIFFALKYFYKKPKETLFVLVSQFISGIIAFSPVYLLKM